MAPVNVLRFISDVKRGRADSKCGEAVVNKTLLARTPGGCAIKSGHTGLEMAPVNVVCFISGVTSGRGGNMAVIVRTNSSIFCLVTLRES